MEFSGDRPPSAPFVVTEESMRFWACPWEELEVMGDSSAIAPSTMDSRPLAQGKLSPANFPETQDSKRSLWGQWLMWSLMTLAYVGTISLIGYGVYEAIGHWGPRLSQSQQSSLGL